MKQQEIIEIMVSMEKHCSWKNAPPAITQLIIQPDQRLAEQQKERRIRKFYMNGLEILKKSWNQEIIIINHCI